jgi:hypothetical protein
MKYPYNAWIWAGSKMGLLLFMVLFLFNQQSHRNIPPFIFPELDQSVVSLWLAATANDPAQTRVQLNEVKRQWRIQRADVEAFPLTAYNPYLLVGTLDALLAQMQRAQAAPDYDELAGLSYHFLWEFKTIRAFHRQNYYPLDAWWDVYNLHQEISFATHDPELGLLEWQELECLFDELVCLLQEYEAKAEANLTRYAPTVDEDAHKDAMNRIYVCINDYQQALTTGYRNRLLTPCDEITEGLKLILTCYTKEGVTL